MDASDDLLVGLGDFVRIGGGGVGAALEVAQDGQQQLGSFQIPQRDEPFLSDTDCPDSLIEMFENGARGFIPTTNTGFR